MTLKERILSRYSAMYDRILGMEIGEFLEFVKKMQERIKEEEMKREYNSILPWMHAGFLKLMSFEDYADMRTGANIDRRPTDEILMEVEAVRAELGE